MFGGYVWSLVALAVLLTGAVMAFVTLRYSRTHGRRSEAEKRVSKAVTEENYRHPVKQD
jgi:hypothetical protein